jgi:hypothetical protein
MIRSSRSLASWYRIWSSGRRGIAGATLAGQHPHGYLPNSPSPIVSTLQFFNNVNGERGGLIPTYRVLDGLGVPIEGAEIPEVCILSAIAQDVVGLCISDRLTKD